MKDQDAVARSDALLEAIYQSALEPGSWLSLHQHLLKNFHPEPPATENQRSLLTLVLDHLQRALKLAERRERVEWERAQVAEFIDAVAPPLCVVRADRTIVGLNSAARRLLRADVDMRLSADFLAAPERDSFERTFETAQREGHAALGVGEGDDGAGWFLHIARLAVEPELLFSVVVFDQSAALQRAIDQYAELFRLTPKERSVLAQALRCKRLTHAAEAEGIGYHTTRQHLKAVYAKTGASTQAELVARVLRQTVVQEAARTNNPALLPHVRGLAHSHFIRVGTSQCPRQLCYAEYGDPEGTPLLYFHSIVGSRLELLMHDQLLRAHGVRLIAVDRPGFGHSDFYEYGSYGAYLLDIRRLLDVLGLTCFGVLSCSAGTPHALACAAEFGDRVLQVHCTGSLVTNEHLAASASRTVLRAVQANLFRIAPSLVRPAVELMFRGRSVEALYRTLLNEHSITRAHPLDAAFISQPEHLDYFIAFTIESLRQGPKAWGKEAAMAHHDWGIAFERTRCPVTFWHGGQDDLVPEDMIASFAAEFHDARLIALPAETHWLLFRQLGRILQTFQVGSTPTRAALEFAGR